MPGDWRQDAACRDMTPEESDRIFFPPTTASAEAKQVCGGCMVRLDCRQFARDGAVEFGIFGGETAAERKRFIPASDPAEETADSIVEAAVMRQLYGGGVSMRELGRRFGRCYVTVRRALDGAA